MTNGLTKCCRKLAQTRSLETKDAILQAGIRLFADFGFHKINTKDIAKAAGISIGSFYGYYPDKKQLFIDLIHIYKSEHLNATTCEHDNTQPCDTYTQEEVIQYFVRRKLNVAEKYPLAFHHELNHMRFRDEDIKAIFDDYYEKEIQIFETSLSTYADLLRISDLHVAANLIYQVSDDMINTYLSYTDSEAKTKLLSAYTDMIKRYIFK